MPQYPYVNIADENEKRDFVFKMNDTKPDVIEADGKKWRRDWSALRVQGAVDGKLNCFSQSAFVEKTAKMKGTIGDIWEKSRELSEQRAKANGGVDEVKEKFYKDYEKKARGAKHPDLIKKAQDKEYTIG
jgi:hypothetical protein